jgi:hypothetical protein
VLYIQYIESTMAAVIHKASAFGSFVTKEGTSYGPPRTLRHAAIQSLIVAASTSAAINVGSAAIPLDDGKCR